MLSLDKVKYTDTSLSEEEFKSHLFDISGVRADYKSSSTSFSIMKLLLGELGPSTIKSASDEEVRDLVSGVSMSDFGGAFTGLRTEGLMEDKYRLTDKAIELLRLMADKFALA